MIVLRVLSYNGAPADGPSAQFDELGGTIGRADNNQLVLPDPERTISRVHARVVFRAGAYAVVDNGSNPISVNGMVVGAGREQPLKPGDALQIGGYLLTATAAAAAVSSDPFADLFGDAPGLAAPVAPQRSQPQTSGWPPPPAPAASPAWPPPPPPAFAPSYAPAPRAPAPPAGGFGAAQIPDDWDPFAPDAAAPAAAQPSAAMTRDPFADLPAPGDASLDDLFGLSNTPSSGDPLGGAPAQAFLAQPNTAQSDDVMASLARTATLVPPTHSDHASELNTPMLLPQATPVAPAPASPLPAGAIFSWDDPPRDGRVVTLPGVRRGALDALDDLGFGVASPPAPPPAPLPPPPPPPRARVEAPTAPVGPAASDSELHAALLRGLDMPELRMNALTPQHMELIGQLLRETTRGAVELLVARAALKREMRAEVTMIVSRENNPLKFSPTVEVALQHLLGAPTPGFMPPAAAVRDAFDDLRAHQLGVMAGMRAALEGVLGRFDPQQLEGKLTRKSAINSILPATRKARLWELFQELFAQLQSEAQDDFDELFGKAFLRAYEDQLDRLQREPGPR